MSKLDELIKELCPNGVEYKELKDLCIISRGKVISKDYIRDNPGDFPVYSSQTENEGNLGNISTYDYDGEYLTWTTDGANAGTVFYRNTKFNVTNVCGLLKVKVEEMISKFLYYFLVIKAPEYVNRGMGNPKLMSNVMEKIKVPIPPLEVQEEIVRILDDYTKSVEELKEKLNKELIARKKQYSWYRDYLLKFENKVEKSKLSEVATIKARIGWQGLTKEEYLIIGNYYLITGTDFQNGEINLKNCYYVNEERYIQDKNIQLKNDDVLVTKDGTLGKVAYVSNLDKPATLNSGIFVIRSIDTNKLLNRYLFHYLKAPYLMKYAQNKLTGGTIKHLNQNVIVDFEIPLPPLEVQKRIVEVLDNFEKICNDLNIGLPAEIEARQKQYEFYRNFLLTFKEDSVNSLRQDKTRYI